VVLASQAVLAFPAVSLVDNRDFPQHL
jgi:hypothetical protein